MSGYSGVAPKRALATAATTTAAKPVRTRGYIENPKFDERTGRRGAVDSTGKFVMMNRSAVQRGHMITDEPAADGMKYILNFQFNPTSFQHSSQMNPNIPLETLPDQGGGDNWMSFASSTGQQVNFNLLFDRTFETWSTDPSNPASVTGVLADVKTLYAMLGMYEDFSTDAGTNGSINPQGQPLTPAAPLRAVPMWVVFGPLMSYYGLVAGVDVTFTHFTQRMVPVRAAVSISFNVMPRVGSQQYRKGGSGQIKSSAYQPKTASRMNTRIANTNGYVGW